MKNFTTILKLMFAVFFALQIIFYTRLYAGNNEVKNPFNKENNFQFNQDLKPGSNEKFRIGGISKVFTSAIILQMVDEKRIQLGTSIVRFFPDIPNAQHISIEDLMTGRIQITNYLQGGKYYEPILSKYVFDELAEEEKKLISAEDDFKNTNYLVLGMIIEKVSGLSYAEELSNRIIQKLSLMNTFNGTTNTPVILTNDTSEALGKWDLLSINGSGSIISTLADIQKFTGALFNYEVISEKSLNNMIRICSESGFILCNQYIEQKP